MAMKHGGRGPGHLSRWAKAAGESSIFPMSFTSGLPSGATFARDSSALDDGSGTVSYFTTDQLRYASGQGALIEPASSNETPSGAYGDGQTQKLSEWGANQITLSATSSAPDGSSTATLATSTGTSAFIYLIGVSLTGDMTFSCYVKKGTARYYLIDLYGGAADYVAVFDLLNGTYLGNAGQTSTTSRSITSIGGGWYRVVMTVASAVTGTNRVLMAPTTGNTFTTANTETIYWWGAQFETGLIATSYIPVKNKILHSEALGTSPHIIENITITANATTAPNGTVTADKLVEIAGLGNHEVYQGDPAFQIGEPYTLSGYAKMAERRYVAMHLNFNSGGDTTSWTGLVADLQSGAIVKNATGAGTTVYDGSTITSMGDGWYRVTLTGHGAIAGGGWGFSTTNGPDPAFGDFGSTNYDSEAVGSGAYWWGLQLEHGSAVTPYFRTNADNKSRAADALSFTIPAGVSTLRYTFDDDSTQDVSVSPGAYTVPTNLNRPRIKTIAVA